MGLSEALPSQPGRRPSLGRVLSATRFPGRADLANDEFENELGIFVSRNIGSLKKRR